jgi:hypothetical protein
MSMKSILRKRSITNSSLTSACLMQYSNSSALKRVLTGTVTAPSVAAAQKNTTHSIELPMHTATWSPRRMPLACSAAATCRTSCHSCA